ncbi:methyltransferase domain-containing protein [uncultured Azonexus sp.]|uniref:class I SAM-dependent methyltransferase n=1 Tax=uncultured Azonexus sp. TaxID=520307 RepID=UPI002607E138|nr:methyltransferase domain-containing protein [uncultured Azonexus sp.]
MAQIIRPSGWIERYSSCLPAAGRILDLACGSGRHARFLAGQGRQVLAVDRDASALAALNDVAGIETRCLDLEGEVWPLAGETFAGIVVTNYLWRPRLPELLGQLAGGGVLIYETFMLGNEAWGKPSNPDFLLRPGELRAVAAAAGLEEIAWFEGYAGEPKPCVRQAIVARRPT